MITRVFSHRTGTRRDNPTHATGVSGSRVRRRLRGSHVVRATRMSAARSRGFAGIQQMTAGRQGHRPRPASITSTSAGFA